MDFERFVSAQEGIYEGALAQIRRGRKTGHWMWFIFPQLRGLGHSDMSIRYALGSLDEAQAYLEHPVLGPRLRECVAALQDVIGKSAEEVFGTVDAQKLRSSLTLFEATNITHAMFDAALVRWFAGQRDQRTIALLS